MVSVNVIFVKFVIIIWWFNNKAWLVEDVKFYIGDVQLPLVVPILYLVIVTLLVAVPLITKPKESAIGFAMMVGTGVVYYLLVITWTNKPAALRTLMGTSRLNNYDIVNNLHKWTYLCACA